MTAFVLGLVQPAAPKGTIRYRTIGWILGEFDGDNCCEFILHPRHPIVGAVEPIHLLSIFTLVTLPVALLHARRHKIVGYLPTGSRRAHRWLFQRGTQRMRILRDTPDSLTEGAIADLIMILQKGHKCGGRQV